MTEALYLLLAEIGVLAVVLAGQTRQAWVALDQWLHCLVYDDASPDETYSARCWREFVVASDPAAYRKWRRRVEAINWLFDDPEHCRAAFHAELERRQLPAEYQTDWKRATATCRQCLKELQRD